MEARDLFFFPFPYGATEKGTRRISKKKIVTDLELGSIRPIGSEVREVMTIITVFVFCSEIVFPAKNLRLKFARPSNSRAAISSSQTHLQYREGICNVTYTLNKGRRQFASRTHQVFKMYIMKKGN